MCDCRGSVSPSQSLLLLPLTKAGLNFKLRRGRSVATTAVCLIGALLVDLRIKSDRREMPQQLSTVQEVTTTQLFGDRGTILRVFASWLGSWRAPFWGRVQLLVASGAERRNAETLLVVSLLIIRLVGGASPRVLRV